MANLRNKSAVAYLRRRGNPLSLPLPNVTLVIGGARSGKSRFAEKLIEAKGQGLYLATAEPLDDEMKDRIARHKARRGDVWETIEEPLEIVRVLLKETRPDRPILLDCLTLWLSYLRFKEKSFEEEINRLIGLLQSGALRGPVVFVSNEIGLGVVPGDAVSRIFMDAQGELNQSVAKIANRVVLVTAGIPQTLKDENQ